MSKLKHTNTHHPLDSYDFNIPTDGLRDEGRKNFWKFLAILFSNRKKDFSATR